YGAQQVEVRRTNTLVQLESEPVIELAGLDDLLDVGKIPQAVRGAHPGGELEFDEPGERKNAQPFYLGCRRARIRERDRLGLPIPWVLAGHQDLDANICLRVADRPRRPWVRPDVPTASHPPADPPEAPPRAHPSATSRHPAL